MKGDVVVVPFPFSDLTQAKRRPALVIAELEGDDLILCQITSRIFTADRKIILYRVGSLKSEKLREIIERIVDILRR